MTNDNNTPPKLTHHQIDKCRSAIDTARFFRQRQLDDLQVGNESVLDDLQNEEFDILDDEGNQDSDMAIDCLSNEIKRYSELEQQLDEVLKYCEHCGKRASLGIDWQHDNLWLCEECDRALEAAE